MSKLFIWCLTSVPGGVETYLDGPICNEAASTTSTTTVGPFDCRLPKGFKKCTV